MALQPAFELPDGLGATWFQVISDDGEFVDPQERLISPSVLEIPRHALQQLFEQLESAGWMSTEILLIGHGQGGTVALDTSIHYALNAVVSIGGHLFQPSSTSSSQTSHVFIACKSNDAALLEQDKGYFEACGVRISSHVLQHEFPRTKVRSCVVLCCVDLPSHSCCQNDIQPLMQFLAQVVKRRMPTMEQIADAIA